MRLHHFFLVSSCSGPSKSCEIGIELGDDGHKTFLTNLRGKIILCHDDYENTTKASL
jgi:hypothetical protein